MDILRREEGNKTVLELSGRLDTNTSEKLENELMDLMNNNVKNITIDLKGLDYVSSAGLRVFLGAQKKISADGGSLTLLNPNETIEDVFNMTGFSNLFNIN